MQASFQVLGKPCQYCLNSRRGKLFCLELSVLCFVCLAELYNTMHSFTAYIRTHKVHLATSKHMLPVSISWFSRRQNIRSFCWPIGTGIGMVVSNRKEGGEQQERLMFGAPSVCCGAWLSFVILLTTASLVSEIPAGDGKIVNLFLQCPNQQKVHCLTT